MASHGLHQKLWRNGQSVSQMASITIWAFGDQIDDQCCGKLGKMIIFVKNRATLLYSFRISE